MRLKEAQQHNRSCIDGGWQGLELNLECPRPESAQVTLVGLGLCDQLKENPDAKVKGEIWAEPEQRPESPAFCSVSFSRTLGGPNFWRGKAVRLLSCPFCPAWSNRLNYEMEGWFEFSLNESKFRPERNVCWEGRGVERRAFPEG